MGMGLDTQIVTYATVLNLSTYYSMSKFSIKEYGLQDGMRVSNFDFEKLEHRVLKKSWGQTSIGELSKLFIEACDIAASKGALSPTSFCVEWPTFRKVFYFIIP
jgi:hypothetical protein